VFFFASDLHYGMNAKGDSSVERLADKLSREGNDNDALFLGGDLATDDEHVRRCLRLFHEFRGRRYAILGNHDVWVDAGDNSLARHARLQNLMSNEGFHPLEEQSAMVDGWGLVGAMGWYDYSFADAALGIDLRSFREKREPWTNRVVWTDATRVRWDMNDLQATAWQIGRLHARLAEVSGAERVIALLHHVPHKRLLVHPRWLVPKQWRFANAFLGADGFGRLLEEDGRVKLAVNGHIHMSRETRQGSTRYASLGGDYYRKQVIAFDGAQVRRMTISA
jgi:putative phosphoesterase